MPSTLADDADDDATALHERLSEQILLNLLNIIGTFEFADEVGRERLLDLIEFMLDKNTLSEESIRRTINLLEMVLPDTKERFRFVFNICRSPAAVNVSDPQIASIVRRIADPNYQTALQGMKLEILELKEQEQNLVNSSNYDRAAEMSKQVSEAVATYIEAIRAYAFDQEIDHKYLDSLVKLAVENPTELLKNLRIIFYTISSKNVGNLEPCVLKLYDEMISRQCGSKDLLRRDWAFKCSTAIALHYRQYAKRVFNELSKQFLVHSVESIWATCALAICELCCRYGITHFENEIDGIETMGDERSAYDDELSRAAARSPTIKTLLSIFDFVDSKVVRKALVQGLCLLILSGQKTPAMVSKILLQYFRTAIEDDQDVEDSTDLEVNQTIGVFFATLVKTKQQDCLPDALFDAVDIMLQSIDGRYHFMPETVIKFVAVTTAPSDRKHRLNVHNRLAEIFVEMILQRSDEKEFVKIVVKQLNELHINADVVLPTIKPQILELLERKCITDSRTTKLLKAIIEQGSPQTTFNTNLTADSDNRPDSGSQSGDDDYEDGDLLAEGGELPEEATVCLTK